MNQRTILIALVLSLLPAVAFGEVFTVVLKSGATFDTRYRPVDAEWDSSISMILTDQGNWIALPKSDILDVTSSVEESGYGVQIDSTTILLGWTYNGDLGLEESQEEGQGQFPLPGGLPFGARGVAPGPYPIGTPGALSNTPQQTNAYTIQQFVNAPIVGSSEAANSGGIPLEYTVY